jgi:hypothetical protein
MTMRKLLEEKKGKRLVLEGPNSNRGRRNGVKVFQILPYKRLTLTALLKNETD